MILPSLLRPVAAALLSTALTTVLSPSAGAQQAQHPARQQPTRPAQATPEKPPAPSGQARPGASSSPSSRTAQPTPTGGRAGPASAPGGSAAALVASFGDWGVYTAQTGRTKICYALTQPKDRQPKNVNRDPAYLFVSFRPAENVRNEVALVMGFSTRENAAAEASIGNAKYDLLTKDQNAWLKNPAEESQAITTMARGQNVLVKAQSSRGNQLTDRYSLSGFGQALERARRECS
jgi:Invasion associated locus B (IalB) protein